MPKEGASLGALLLILLTEHPMLRHLRAAAILLSGAVALPSGAQQPAPAAAQPTVGTRWSYASERTPFVAEVVATGIAIPFGMTFLPDGRMLVTDRRAGRLVAVDLKRGTTRDVRGVPAVWGKEDAGLLDVILHPRYAENGWIYYSFSAGDSSGSTLAVERAKLRDDALVDRERLFTARGALPNNTDHFGGRLVISRGYLFITSGDRAAHRDSAQVLTSHFGKVLRLFDDGRIPPDNPFTKKAGALPEIWSYGHRNPQGLTLRPGTNDLWEIEHGPKGGDELNLIRGGANYGWPVITYGEEYKGGPVGKGITAMEGMEQPVHYYKPSIAPSGVEFYTGNAFPAWKGNVFIGALALTHLNRLEMKGDSVVHEERLIGDRNWRVRIVRTGPDGLIYLAVDGGMVIRLRPEH
ncbi:MAG: PQQ-dependent sugar dehydrogenase [Gemmatimonadaceae bacterium]